jgi:hypothetical protein
MSTVKGPLFSFHAHGSLGRLISYRDSPYGSVAESKPGKYPAPDARQGVRLWPPSSKQNRHRQLIRCLGTAWRYLTIQEQFSWLGIARKSNNTCFSEFMAENCRSFYAGRGMHFSATPSFSPYGQNVEPIALLDYYGGLRLQFNSLDPAHIFFLLIGHFSPTEQQGNFDNCKFLHFWNPEFEYLPNGDRKDPQIYSDHQTSIFSFEFVYRYLYPQILFIPWAVGLKSGYVFSSCIAFRE